MRSDIYLHSLHSGSVNYSGIKTRELLEKILKSGEILSPRLSGIKCNYNFSGLDYISLCDYEKKHLGKGYKNRYNGFYQYAVFDPSLMFPKEGIEVIEPIILDQMIVFYSNYRTYMKELGLLEERYTDLADEVQVRDRVSLETLCGFTIPTYEFLRRFKSVEHDAKVTYEELLKYKELFDKYGYDLPFYDVNTTYPMDTYEDVYEVVLNLKRKK